MMSIWNMVLIVAFCLAVALTSNATYTSPNAYNPSAVSYDCSKDESNLPTPVITGHPGEFLDGETFTLTCKVDHLSNSAMEINWKPPPNVTVITESNTKNVTKQLLWSTVTVVNASKADEGVYMCTVQNNCGKENASFTMMHLSQPSIALSSPFGHEGPPPYRIDTISFFVNVEAHPNDIDYNIYKDGVLINFDSGHYNSSYDAYTGKIRLIINNSTAKDTGHYNISVFNRHMKKNITFFIQRHDKPIITGTTDNITCVVGMRTTISCEAIGYPRPAISWQYLGDNKTIDIPQDSRKIHNEYNSLYKVTSRLDIDTCVDGNITCFATNNYLKNQVSSVSKSRRILVDDIYNGFGIISKNNKKEEWFAVNDEVTIQCLASFNKFDNVTWLVNISDSSVTVNYPKPLRHSLVAELNIKNILLNHQGNYTCMGTPKLAERKNVTSYDYIFVNVAARETPSVVLTHTDESKLYPLQNIFINCTATGVPLPRIEWYKDRVQAVNSSNVTILSAELGYKTMSSKLTINQVQNEQSGTYTCTAVGENGITQSKSYYLVLNKNDGEDKMKYYIVIGVILVITCLVSVFFYRRDKIRKRRWKEDLRKAGLEHFMYGATNNINPELGIDEQADLLPYDKKFEFPRDKLEFVTKLGAGAFGVVYKARARGINNAEETTFVAVKMVEKTADNMYIKALASELKVMIHLGNHINIVNLKGACTNNVMKRELLVILEYCVHGNIHNYMQKHKEVFIDQLSDNNEENNLGTVNIAYSQSGSTGVQSEYFGSTNTQDTLLNTANTNHNRKISAGEGYVQPEWRSNYVSEYSYSGQTKRPLTSRDLLYWAFQVAKGMEYLAKRKIQHGDLAARNILLAEDNIVKICDFGLARSLYKNDEYIKKENSLLPVKWLAIECMTERLFTTQSDVWSFGVVLWEMFTLSKTPYPNINPANLLSYLLGGHRLEKPTYADDRIYALMKRCWQEKPSSRPSFTELQETLDSYLEDHVRNHYQDLGAGYTSGPAPGVEDYLQMVSAPDYNLKVTPSPHNYVNSNAFFPLGSNDVGADVGKNIFSPRLPGTKFNFDAHKLNGRPSVASSEGTELTPMLKLTGLQSSGSDSDHEGPNYPNTHCDTIDEETDDVFETKQQRNLQNIAVSNPTYSLPQVICANDIEKKPLPLSYVNLEPNGLVK